MCIYIYMCICMKSEVTQSCPTLCDPTDCNLPGSSVHGIFRASVLEWGAIAFCVYMYMYTQTHHFVIVSLCVSPPNQNRLCRCKGKQSSRIQLSSLSS